MGGQEALTDVLGSTGEHPWTEKILGISLLKYFRAKVEFKWKGLSPQMQKLSGTLRNLEV